jgi:hypothetical protein
MWRLKLSLQNLLYIGQLILCLKTTLNLLYIVLTQNLCAAQAAELACKNSIQAHGAMGYTWEMDLHIYMRKAWSMMACWGNEDKQQELIFKTLSSTSEELGVLYTF